MLAKYRLSLKQFVFRKKHFQGILRMSLTTQTNWHDYGVIAFDVSKGIKLAREGSNSGIRPPKELDKGLSA